jgi:glycerol-3-phosphate dehydrogenase subunit C
MREGSLEAPVRHPIDWQNPDFWDEAKLDAEMRRVFDICHGCRRCFNLCDSFPRLFDLIDATEHGLVEDVKSEDFGPVVDACTLCDMCFMTKCPYVPPHQFNLDFPHLMLRARAIDAKNGKEPFAVRELTKVDRNGKLGSLVAPLANWATDTHNKLTRTVLEKMGGVHHEAKLPEFHGKTFALRARKNPPKLNAEGPAKGRKAALYATCFVNYNNPNTGTAAQAILAHNGVETKVVYPRCCGMPQLEQGEIEKVAETAKAVAAELSPIIDEGYDIVALMPSCALMLKFEWPLILPGDKLVEKLAKATFDVSEYMVDIAKRHGLAPGLKPLDGGVSVHLACHARAQNMGQKAAEMLRLIPEIDLAVIERCSGHGGSWGVMKDNFATALKVGKPVARTAAKNGKTYLASECPLAGEHIVQGLQRLDEAKPNIEHSLHPVELLAKAYGLVS